MLADGTPDLAGDSPFQVEIPVGPVPGRYCRPTPGHAPARGVPWRGDIPPFPTTFLRGPHP